MLYPEYWTEAVRSNVVRRVMPSGGARLRLGASGVSPRSGSPPAGVDSTPRRRALCAGVLRSTAESSAAVTMQHVSY